MCKDGEVISVILRQYQIWYKWRVYLQISKPYTWGPLVIPSSPLSSFSFLHPSSPFPLCPPKRKEKSERESDPPHHSSTREIARNSGNRKRDSNLTLSSTPLVNPSSLLFSFRVFVFLGFRWKPVELHQIDCTMSLLFLKCLFVDFVFQFATKTRFSQFPQMWREMGTSLLNWIKPDPNRVCEWVGALMTKLIDNQTELWLFMP